MTRAFSQNAKVSKQQSSTSERTLYWEEEIRKLGDAKAYEALAREVKDKRISEQHTEAHSFGGALYAVSGLSGLSVCDSQFSFGCFHEFLGKAIQERGLAVVPKLNEACQQALTASPLSCQHGIGHGVTAYIGYGRDDLDKELEVCKKLPYNDPIGGCYAGVFMEYNMRTMLGAEGGTREIKNDNWFDPCDSLSDEYQQACAFWQPQWWSAQLWGASTTEGYAKLGSLCDEMEKNPNLRRSCYEGIGTIAPAGADQQGSKAAVLCEATSKSKLYQLYCTSFAANSMTILVNKQEGYNACDGLDGESREYCNAYAENRSNILLPHDPPKDLL